MLCEPLVDFEPLQLPEAVQELMFVPDQLSVAELPAATVNGDALRDTVGLAGAVPLPSVSL